MASAGQTRNMRFHGPALATTYEGNDPTLLSKLLPLVDLLEITPDTIAIHSGDSVRLNPEVLAELTNAGVRNIIVHGIGLSIASADGVCDNYLRLLDEIFVRFNVLWHSEHLAYTTVQGETLGTMLPPPRTEEALDLVSERVCIIMRRFPVPFLLEHVIRLLPEPPGEYSEAGFLNALAERTGCGILLDLYNLECDAKNMQFDIGHFLDELHLAQVRELHVAGGVNYRGFQLDVHSRQLAPSTVTLMEKTLPRLPNVQALTFEFLKEAVPHLGHQAILDELQDIRTRFLCEPRKAGAA